MSVTAGLIETLWNVKSIAKSSMVIGTMVLIETLCNVKSFFDSKILIMPLY